MRRQRKSKSDLNVVPYIDVMLVLLVIFMISAPLLNQSIEVDLPSSDNAQDIASDASPADLPFIVSIDKDNAYFIENQGEILPVTQSMIAAAAQDVRRQTPNKAIYIRADKNVRYEKVMRVMDILQAAGVGSVGLITEPSGDEGANDGKTGAETTQTMLSAP